MDYEKKNRQPYTPEQLQAHLAQAWKWAEMALDRYPGEIPGELRSHQITTSEEADQGIYKIVSITHKSSEIIFTVEADSHNREEVGLEDSETITRYRLVEETNGTFALDASPHIRSAGQAELLSCMRRPVSDGSYHAAVSKDEQDLEDLMHPASREEVDDLLDVTELASLGDRLPDYSMWWLDFFVNEWRHALENPDPDNEVPRSELDYQDQESSPQQKLTPRIVFSALRNYLKKYRGR